MSSFEKIALHISSASDRIDYCIPGLWLNSSKKIIKVDAYDFFRDRIDSITNAEAPAQNASPTPLVYNLFVRLFSAWDHNQDGRIGGNKGDITLNDEGIRESGTFLKCIALLPYLKDLGVTHIHLLPVTKVGKAGRKGNLGSPYAIKNPYTIEESLADPLIPFNVEEQFSAFMEAAHLLGFKVILEFILRTAALDSDLIAEHPYWFYWIDQQELEQFAQPEFSIEALSSIMKIPDGEGKYIEPSAAYRSKFKKAPTKDRIKVDLESLRYIGSGEKGNLTVVNAFADWPPNDPQPTWDDVTYYRIFEDRKEKFNYVAYNTVRYYDPELSTSENRVEPLWDMICDIIPYYIKQYDIDGVMLDMGHALPSELKMRIIAKARECKSEFLFWDESFELKEEHHRLHYDAIIGDYWYHIQRKDGFEKLFFSLGEYQAIPSFGTPETHNSPRFCPGKLQRKMAAWLLLSLHNNCLSFLHNGFELDEDLPVNTGLNFSNSTLQRIAGEPLALFDISNLKWTNHQVTLKFIRQISELRKQNPDLFDRQKEIQFMDTANSRIGCAVLCSNQNEYIYVQNFDFKEIQDLLPIPLEGSYQCLFNNVSYDFTKHIMLQKGQFILAKKMA